MYETETSLLMGFDLQPLEPSHKHFSASRRLCGIVASLPLGTPITTPRHHVQYVITEYGVANLGMLTNVERAQALVELRTLISVMSCAMRPERCRRNESQPQ